MKNIIVTGASRGIGKALVELFLEQGHSVIAISRNTEKLKAISNSEKYSFLSLDFFENIEESSVFQAFLEKLEKENKKIDILVNNAGYLVNKPISELSANDFLKCYHVNSLSPTLLIKNLLKHFTSSAHIVNISTMGAVQGSVKFPGLAAYSSTKASICNVTELLSEELKETGIKINALALGAVQTEMLSEAFPDYKAPLQPEEMASYIANFAHNASDFFNGKILPVSSTTP